MIENLSKLYENLIKGEFIFLGKGEFELHDIYSAVKKKYPDLCDDNFMCDQCCIKGNKNDPEWHHRVRATLGRLKDAGRNVKKGRAWKFWIIGGTAIR